MKTMAVITLLFSLLASSTATATSIRINFSGTLFNVSASDANYTGALGNGDRVSGEIVVDLALATDFLEIPNSIARYSNNQSSLLGASFIEYQIEGLGLPELADENSPFLSDNSISLTSEGRLSVYDIVEINGSGNAGCGSFTSDTCLLMNASLNFQPESLAGLILPQGIDNSVLNTNVTNEVWFFVRQLGLPNARIDISVTEASVSPIPLPAAAPLFVTGFLILMGITRRKNWL